jgi:membrane protease YdiL (CAAX protease family)
MGRFVAAALLLYGPYAWCRWRGEAPSAYGLEWRFDGRSLFEALAATAVALATLTGVALWWPYETLPHHRDLRFVLNFAASGLAAAVIEETFYRGFLQTLLRRLLPAAPAVVLVSALFAASHLILFPYPLLLTTFFPGLVMGILRERSGSVAPGALFHFLGNLWAIWFFPTP